MSKVLTVKLNWTPDVSDFTFDDFPYLDYDFDREPNVGIIYVALNEGDFKQFNESWRKFFIHDVLRSILKKCAERGHVEYGYKINIFRTEDMEQNKILVFETYIPKEEEEVKEE